MLYSQTGRPAPFSKAHVETRMCFLGASQNVRGLAELNRSAPEMAMRYAFIQRRPLLQLHGQVWDKVFIIDAVTADVLNACAESP